MKKLFTFCAAMLLALAVNVKADTYFIAGDMNGWSGTASEMTEVSTGLYMAQFNLSGWHAFKPVINGSWINYAADKVNASASDVTIEGNDDGQGGVNFSFNLPGSPAVITTKIYWDAVAQKIYVQLDPSTLSFNVVGNTTLGLNTTPAEEGNDMTYNGDGTFTLVKKNVTLAASINYWYKVTAFHSWDMNYGDPNNSTDYYNKYVNVAQAGNYNITFTFDWSTKTVSADAERIPVVKLTGNFTDPEWTENSALTLVDNGDGTCSVTKHFAVDVISFKLIVDGSWYGDQNHSKMTRGNQGEGWEIAYDIGYNNTQLDIDLEGDYVFTYTYATRKLLVTYPLIVREAANTNYQSLCTPYDGTLDGAVAYALTSASAGGVNISSVENLEAGHSYLIKPNAAGTITLNYTASGATTVNPIDNHGETAFYGQLVGNYVYNYNNEMLKDVNDRWLNVFVLGTDNLFHQIIAGGEVTINPTRAYLHIAGQELVPNTSAPGLRIIETATDIESIEAVEEAVKFFQNGQLFIKKNGVVYDMMGAVVK